MAGVNVEINENLVKERSKCTFNVKELTHIFDGGEKLTQERKRLVNAILSVKELQDEVSELYLSYNERYENVVRKGILLHSVLKESKDKYGEPDPRILRRAQGMVFRDMSPFLLHLGMFILTIEGQGTPEQQSEWLPKAHSMQIIGSYAQTELGHGTFLRGLETTATYDASTEEFILNSPKLTSYKWWPGGLGSTINHCIIAAQLHINGKNHGIHMFMVQIRDLETHLPLPGIKVGEIGPKLGFQTVNNGFLGFNNFRIPRKNMLMKNSQVLKDGTYIKGPNDKLTYGTMVRVRVNILSDVALYVAKAATIAVRYSAVRHQSQLKAKEPETQILDYLTQQHKLFIAIATSHAYVSTYAWMIKKYFNVVEDLGKGKLDHLPELHALTCCLKATSSRDGATLVEQCRLACGGHGYMASSNLPILYGLATATVTYEGEHTVVLLQTARYLMKAWTAALQGKVLAPSVSYLADGMKFKNQMWQNTPEGIIEGLHHVAAGKIKDAFDVIQKHVKAGNDYEDAWNLASVQLIKASEAHSRAILCDGYWRETIRNSMTASTGVASVLGYLAQLYIVYWGLETSGDLLMYSNISREDVTVLKEKYEVLLTLIRPNAVALVDAFDFYDQDLHSTLGSYDGRVYERLMEDALKSPLNKEPVNQSFHKYLKPFIKSSKL
ncbi:probable peroxisomal acyl-coenzyme A oxidase 1 [Ostrinia furnacalis]|uniref:probable peroxisomal acyl-coenzyme A oxidase 1 n=1 Tax=Ostrinia furnacalis TaxID=93504 RepID=UPI001039131B|nr:probable peroxisomal acyl-coenzyme A oxidase 1 [Ostrinia furnacalis]